ncbi:MAG: cyanophycinase [bacterium]
MRGARRTIPLAALLLLITACGRGPVHGPPSGTLMIIGGAADGANYEMFMELAGGPQAKIVVVPTAGGRAEYDAEVIRQRWADRYGARNVHVLHTRDRAVAESDSFARVLYDADAVYFLGGRQWRLVDAYAGTLAEEAFHQVLERGGLIAGSSAGASIQASFLARGAEEGNRLMIAPEPEHWAGFGFLRCAAVDQHIDRRDRWDDLRVIVMRHPDLLGIGISEATAIIVEGDLFEVVGRGRVVVHDYHRSFSYADSTYYLVLEPGDRYDMGRREVVGP